MDDTLVNYMRDFSAQVLQYRAQKTEESLALINRTASLLSTTLQQQHVDVQQLQVAKFFIDLHAVMSIMSNDSYALWSCVAVVQQCSRHALTRKVIVEDCRFIPMLTSILERTQAPDKVQKLLTLLQELTYGIKIEYEEPFVCVLLQKLVQIINVAVENNADEQLAQLALSILINLCYKNFVVLFLFMRNINISSFSRSIKNFGMQASKLLIILSEDINTPDKKELQFFLRPFFLAIGESITQWHVAHLRHNVDFLQDGLSDHNLHSAIINYPHYSEDISNLLQQIEQSTVSPSSINCDQQMCMIYIFKLFNFLLQLNAEYNLNMETHFTSIYDLVCPWIESSVCGVEAVHLLTALIRFGK